MWKKIWDRIGDAVVKRNGWQADLLAILVGLAFFAVAYNFIFAPIGRFACNRLNALIFDDSFNACVVGKWAGQGLNWTGKALNSLFGGGGPEDTHVYDGDAQDYLSPNAVTIIQTVPLAPAQELQPTNDVQTFLLYKHPNDNSSEITDYWDRAEEEGKLLADAFVVASNGNWYRIFFNGRISYARALLFKEVDLPTNFLDGGVSISPEGSVVMVPSGEYAGLNAQEVWNTLLGAGPVDVNDDTMAVLQALAAEDENLSALYTELQDARETSDYHRERFAYTQSFDTRVGFLRNALLALNEVQWVIVDVARPWLFDLGKHPVTLQAQIVIGEQLYNLDGTFVLEAKLIRAVHGEPIVGEALSPAEDK